MDARHRGIQIFGWLCVIAGYGFALLLIRGIFIGITRGFRGSPPAFWIVLAYLLFFALTAYLFTVGQRALSTAKGSHPPEARFGWGRMLLGALLIFGGASNHFHVFPIRHFGKSLEYANQTQALAGNVTTVVLYIGCVYLIVWGIWKGFRRQTITPDLGP